jgi:hypothetical protein
MNQDNHPKIIHIDKWTQYTEIILPNIFVWPTYFLETSFYSFCY